MNDLMEWLRSQKDNRGVMAQLRCGLTPGKEHRAWPVLARFGGIEGHRGAAVRAVAGLYASHPDECAVGNMGTVCLRLCSDAETPWVDPSPGPMAMRLQYLLASESDEVCMRAARLVLRCKNKGISVNYCQLFTDLLQWEKHHQRQRVREAWAQEFWAPALTQNLPNTTEPNPEAQEATL